MAARAPLWSRVSEAIATADDAEPILVALLGAPPEQRRPVLAMAALHELLLRHPTMSLARFLAGADVALEFTDVWTSLLGLVEQHGERFRELVGTRHTQTNEVGRCAVLMPALAELDDEVGPLAVVEFGASAGLLLNLDRYHYRYEVGDRVVELTPAGEPTGVTLTCGLRGSSRLPDHLPTIASRLGVDPQPVHPWDDEATRWLQACVWPDQVDRTTTLKNALEAARRWPVPLVRADGVERVPRELSRAVAHPVMLSSWALTYVSAQERRTLWERLEAIGQQRDLTMVLFEDPALIPEFPLPRRQDDRGLTVLVVIRWRSGQRHEQRLGTAHPHGYWWRPED